MIGFIKNQKKKIKNLDKKKLEELFIEPDTTVKLVRQTEKPQLSVIERTNTSITVQAHGADGIGDYAYGISKEATLIGITWKHEENEVDTPVVFHNLKPNTSYWLRTYKRSDGIFEESRIGTLEVKTLSLADLVHITNAKEEYLFHNPLVRKEKRLVLR